MQLDPDGQAPALHIVDVGEHSAVPDAQEQPWVPVVGLSTRLQTIPVPHAFPPHVGAVPHPVLGSVVVVVPPLGTVVVVVFALPTVDGAHRSFGTLGVIARLPNWSVTWTAVSTPRGHSG